MSLEIERWKPRGIGSDCVPCLLTGGPETLRPNISGFVESLEAGLRVVELFGGEQYARLDYRKSEPNWVQVKVGVDNGYEGVLDRLMVVCEDGYITPNRLAWAKYPANNRDGEPAIIRYILSNPDRLASLEMVQKDELHRIANRVQQIYDDYDMASGHHALCRLSVYATKSKYPKLLAHSAWSLTRILTLSGTSTHSNKFWDWFCARNRLLNDRAPAQVFPEDPNLVVNAAKEYFKKEE